MPRHAMPSSNSMPCHGSLSPSPLQLSCPCVSLSFVSFIIVHAHALLIHTYDALYKTGNVAWSSPRSLARSLACNRLQSLAISHNANNSNNKHHKKSNQITHHRPPLLSPSPNPPLMMALPSSALLLPAAPGASRTLSSPPPPAPGPLR
jgi:hypothetical protein